MEAKASDRVDRSPVIDQSGESRGKSRLINAKQQKIARMVEGYESAITAATSLRNVFYLWLVPSVAMVVLGTVTLLQSDQSIGSDATLARWIDTARIGAGGLVCFTLLVAGVWSTKAYLNVRRLGRKPATDVNGLLIRHLPFVPVGALLLYLGTLFDIVQYPLTVIGAGMLVWALCVLPLWSLNFIRMLWTTAARKQSEPIELPTFATAWFVAYAGFFGIGIVLESPFFDLSGPIRQMGFVLQGLASGAAAYFGAWLVMQVSQRQENRLLEIVSDVQVDEEGPRGPVTTEQIGDAWDDSERMISFDY